MVRLKLGTSLKARMMHSSFNSLNGAIKVLQQKEYSSFEKLSFNSLNGAIKVVLVSTRKTILPSFQFLKWCD